MLINSLKLLKKLKTNRALCAFNFSTVEVAEAIVKTASEFRLPIILQTSQGEANFLNPEIAQAIASFLSQKYNLDLSLNLDHARDLNLIKRCLQAGYTSIHIDGSSLSFKENILKTKRVVALCHQKDVSVEAEINPIGGELTNPHQAVSFIKQTQTDFLAISIGEKHGMEKPNLQFELLNKLVRLIKQPLVLHGGSGISKKDLKKVVKMGIKKINFNTELRIAWTHALRKTLNENPKEIVPYKILPFSQKAVARIIQEKLKIVSLNN